MSSRTTRDLLLLELYGVPRDTQTHARVARHAPLLRFDEREPFLPLAAGYTIFTRDGRSPSMERQIRLRPEGKPPAVAAIEYAIWWDWDIHHLYELEHVWIYLDEADRPVRVEASWHGEYRELPLRLENGRAVLLSEPGKHAFAPDPAWFRERQAKYRRAETVAVGAHAGVLVNNLFTGKIRRKQFDTTLARSYLVRQAFEPTWNFSQTFLFPPEALVPWPALYEWIPRRVEAWLERLAANLSPSEYRALHLAGPVETMPRLQDACRQGADSILIPLQACDGRLVLGCQADHGAPTLEEALLYLRTEPAGAIFELADAAAFELLVEFVNRHGLQERAVVTSAEESLLLRYKNQVPAGLTAIQLFAFQDPMLAAGSSGAGLVHLRWEDQAAARARLTRDWVDRVHQAGLGIISWPLQDAQEARELQRLGLDVLWIAGPVEAA